MTETSKVATPPDTYRVGEREIFMSYARILRVASIFPEGLPALANAGSDPAVHASLVEILMAEDGQDPEDYPKFETYKLSMVEGEELVRWGLAHAFGFFARKVNETLQTATLTAETIQSVEAAAKLMTEKMS